MTAKTYLSGVEDGLPIRSKLLLGAAIAGIMCGLGAPALAQDDGAADEDTERVIVTGTRIPRADIIANSPVQVVSEREFELSGTVNAEELVRDLPQTLAGDSHGNTNNGQAGASIIDLRGIGEERTLVLVDGKRFVPFGTRGVVDINQLPTSLIERVDVVTGGASAVYGSDAMAGVVNFILKDDFEGVELGTQWTTTDRGDGETWDLYGIFGSNFDGGRGNVTMHFSYTDREPVLQGDRPFSEFALNSADFSPGGSNTSPEGAFLGSFFIPGEGGPFDFVDFAPDGTLSEQRPEELYNFNPVNLLQVPQERWQATALATYEVREDVELYARTHFSRSTVNSQIAPSGTFFFLFDIPASNPFLSDQARLVLADGDGDGLPDAAFDLDNDGVVDADAVFRNVSFGRRAVEVGPRIQLFTNDTFQTVFGVRGTLPFRSGVFANWTYDASVQHGETLQTQNLFNDVNFANAQASLFSGVDGGGNPICINADGSPNTAGGCIAGNFFGAGNLASDAAAFVRLNAINTFRAEQTVASLNFGGDFSDVGWKSPWADSYPGMAIGMEYREENARADPDDNQLNGNTIGLGSQTATRARFDVIEGYFEARIPLVEGVSMMEEVAFEGGYRYSAYSSAGKVQSYKYGGEWTMWDGFKLRGLFQRAVRAPSVREIGLPRVPTVGDADFDHCQGSRNPGADPVVRALCIAQGAPATAVDNGTIPGPIAGQVNIFLGGNQDLTVESSNTWSIGAVLQPDWFPDLTLQVDYYSITVNDAITAFGGSPNNVLRNCFEVVQDAGSPFCQAIIRNPNNGAIVGDKAFGIELTNQNAAFIATTGIDIQVDYEFETADLGLGDWGFISNQFIGTYVATNEFQPDAASPIDECAGTFGNTCDRPDPHFRFVNRTTLTTGPFAFSARWRHLGAVIQDDFDMGRIAQPSFLVPEIEAQDYLDLTAEWNISEKFTFRTGVTNVFDNDPPVVGNSAGPTDSNSGNTFPGVYDALGREVFLNLRVKL